MLFLYQEVQDMTEEERKIFDSKSRAELMWLIDEWVRGERDRAMFKRKLFDKIVYEDLAEEFDMSTQNAKAIIKKAKEQLLPHCR